MISRNGRLTKFPYPLFENVFAEISTFVTVLAVVWMNTPAAAAPSNVFLRISTPAISILGSPRIVTMLVTYSPVKQKQGLPLKVLPVSLALKITPRWSCRRVIAAREDFRGSVADRDRATLDGDSGRVGKLEPNVHEPAQFPARWASTRRLTRLVAWEPLSAAQADADAESVRRRTLVMIVSPHCGDAAAGAAVRGPNGCPMPCRWAPRR